MARIPCKMLKYRQGQNLAQDCQKRFFTFDFHISSFTGEHTSSGVHENSVDVVIEVSRPIYS